MCDHGARLRSAVRYISCQCLAKNDSISSPVLMCGTSSQSAGRSAYAAPTVTMNIARRTTMLLGCKCCKRTPSSRQIQYVSRGPSQRTEQRRTRRIITQNVAKLVQIPAPRYKIGKGLPVHDVKLLLAEAQHTRLYVLYVLAATLGSRRGELLGLRWSDIDLDLGTITPAKTVQRVRGRLLIDDTKTEDSDNTIPLPRSHGGS